MLVTSAGLAARAGEPADPRAIDSAAERGLGLESHRARPLDTAQVAGAGVIFVMDHLNLGRILSRYPAAADRIFLLGGCRTDGSVVLTEIHDPVSGTLADVRVSHDEVVAATRLVASAIDPAGAMTQDDLQRLFPAGVVVEVATEADEDDSLLHPAEVALTGAMIPARKREFAAGRNAARRALARLGFHDATLPRRPSSHDVLWPEGSGGSISHTRGLRAVACVRSSDLMSVGIDVEQAGPLGEEIIDAICRPEELLALGTACRRHFHRTGHAWSSR